MVRAKIPSHRPTPLTGREWRMMRQPPSRKSAQGNGCNVEALADRTGKVVERYAYTPYGAVTFVTNPGPDTKWYIGDDIIAGTTSARGNSFFFQGRELDGDMGSYQFRFRDYNSSLGEFIQRDPIRHLAKARSLYRFVGNSPCDNKDPSGLIVPAVALCVVIAEEAVVPTIALAAGVMAMCKNREKEKEKSRVRKAYSSRCKEQPPPGLDPCETAKWELQRNKDCYRLREEFGNKWFNDGFARHEEEMRNALKAIYNKEEEVKRKCCK